MKTRSNLHLRILIAAAILYAEAASFGQSSDATAPSQDIAPPDDAPRPTSFGQGPVFGDPLPGLTDKQLAAFLEGLEEFETTETPEEGIGPVFNEFSCVACHSVPATGGGSELFETRFGRSSNGRFDDLPFKGGSLMQLLAIDPAILETVPAEANVVALRRATALFGLGLIEAITDDTIRNNAIRQNSDGISGRVSIVRDVTSGRDRVGRFGWKAQQATLLAFSGDAYLNEMGITSRFFPKENAPRGDARLLAIYDLVPDPEDEVDPATGKSDVDLFADFMRFLGPPPRLPLTRDAQQGQILFSRAGCAICHTPSMTTGANAIPALNRKSVPLYSDLLLHDMGSLGDGIGQGAAKPREMRTAPLWGLRMTTRFLHDGRAKSVDQAIRAHDGEGARARERYVRMSWSERQDLREFLNSN